MTEQLEESQVKKCEGCGTALVFDPETGGLKCPSCGTAVAPEEEAGNDKIVENDLMSMLHAADLKEDAESVSVKCPGCGGDTTFESNVVSGFCSYCNNPIVASDKSIKSIRPQGLLPFLITKDAAQQSFKSWVKSLWFAPNSVKNVNLSKSMKGVYEPAWTFDFDSACHYSGRRGDYYYETQTVVENGKKQTRQVRKTRWRYVTGAVYNSFDDLLVPAGTKTPTDLQKDLEPWNLGEAVDYTEDGVRGFWEHSYDVHLKDGLSDAQETAKDVIRDKVKQDIGGDEQVISSMNVEYTNLTYKLLLLPFWSSSYRFNQKDYVFLVNGQTGKTSGGRPWSWIKLTCLIVAILAAIAAAVCVINLN